MPWDLVMGGLLIAVLLAGVIYFPARIVADAAARRREHHGTVVVAFCVYRGRGNDTAECVGDFRSDDGALHVRDVKLGFHGAHQDMIRRTTVSATLAGPEDSTADVDDDVGKGRAVLWTLDALLFAWLVAQLGWFVRALRRHRSGAPAGA